MDALATYLNHPPDSVEDNPAAILYKAIQLSTSVESQRRFRIRPSDHLPIMKGGRAGESLLCQIKSQDREGRMTWVNAWEAKVSKLVYNKVEYTVLDDLLLDETVGVSMASVIGARLNCAEAIYRQLAVQYSGQRLISPSYEASKRLRNRLSDYVLDKYGVKRVAVGHITLKTGSAMSRQYFDFHCL